MKATRISEHIWRLGIWIGIPIHVWVVVDEEGVSLVDAGISTMAAGILSFIDRLQAGRLQRILLTHGHSDHVGAIKRILQRTSVPVYAHSIEIPYMEGELAYPRRRKAVQVIAKGVTQPLLADDNGRLRSTCGLQPFLTPGHAPGHVVYYHEEDQVLLAGDLFTSKKGKLQKPMAIFTSDMAAAIDSSRILRELKPRHLEICHGHPVSHPADQLEDYLKANEKWTIR